MGNEYADVILMAEDHAAGHHADIEIAMIDDVQPEYVVMEDSPSHIDLDELIDHTYHDETLAATQDRIHDEYGTDLLGTDLDTILERAQTSVEHENERKTCDYTVPETPTELRQTPVYELDKPVIRTVRNSMAERKHLEEQGGRNDGVIEELNSLIDFYTETSNAVDDYGPAAIGQFAALGERVENDELKVVSEPNPYADEPHYANLAYGALVEGTSQREVQKNNIRIMNGRETAIGHDLVAYAEQTDRPVIGLIGKFHALEPSSIYPVLEDHDITYQTVWLPEHDTDIPLENLLTETPPKYLIDPPVPKPVGT